MPASPTATPEHIKDVNTRYHDAAAHEYDAKWGIDFGATGQRQVRLKLEKALGGLDGERFGDGLEIGSGTGYFSLNLVQLGIVERLTATDISPGMLERLGGDRRGDRGRCQHRRHRGRGAPVRRRELRHRLRPRRPPPHSRRRARLRRVPAGPAPGRGDRLRRRALPLRRPARRDPEAGRDDRRPRLAHRGRRPPARVSPRPRSPTATRSRARSTSTPSRRPTCAACCATRGFEQRRVCGEELLANAWGWSLRTLESSAEPESVSWSWRKFAFNSYIALQKVDSRLLEPRLPAELFYNLLASGRRPA